MSLVDCKRSHEQSPPSIRHIQDQIRSTCEDIIHFCSQETEATFYQAEQSLQVKIASLACLFLQLDRKSTRLNSSHVRISYAVFCLKKKKLLRSSRCTRVHL